MIPSVRVRIDLANNNTMPHGGAEYGAYRAYKSDGGIANRVPIPCKEFVELGDFRRLEHTRRAHEHRDAKLLELNKVEARAREIAIDEQRPFGLPQGVNCIDVREKIFDQVHDVEDICSLRTTCQVFKDILEMKYKTMRMIEVVLKFGARFGGLPTILALRGVCKSTKVAIDDWIKKSRMDPSDLLCTSSVPRRIPKPKLRLPTMPQSDEAVDEKGLGPLKTILMNLERVHLSTDTFPLKEIRLDETAMGSNQIDYLMLRNLFERLLELVGNRLTYFEYRTQEDDVGAYNRLRTWTAFMPNLEELSIDVLGDADAYAMDYGNWPAPLPPLPSFPTCPKLRQFENAGTGIRARFVKEILLANPWISRVCLCPDLDDLDWMMQEEIAFLQETLGIMKLEEFYWDGYLTYLPQEFVESKFEWPLKKLTLDITSGYARPGVNSNFVFRFINTFSKTLEELAVTWKLRDNGGFLDLPVVKKLSWTLWPEFRSLEFILPLESLEKLNVDVEHVQELHESVENVKTFFHDMNLPTAFPALRQIRSTAKMRFVSEWFFVWKS